MHTESIDFFCLNFCHPDLDSVERTRHDTGSSGPSAVGIPVVQPLPALPRGGAGEAPPPSEPLAPEERTHRSRGRQPDGRETDSR